MVGGKRWQTKRREIFVCLRWFHAQQFSKPKNQGGNCTMSEEEAWEVLLSHAHKAGITIQVSMSTTVLRRNLAKAYQPRLATDGDGAMRAINPAIDVIEAERERRELSGVPNYEEPPRAPRAAYASGSATTGTGGNPGPGASRNTGQSRNAGARTGQPGQSSRAAPQGASSVNNPKHWQTNPDDGIQIAREDNTDKNYIRKSIFERARRFGDVNLVKAWAWDGSRFRKVLDVYANPFVYDELGRAMVVYVHAQSSYTCDAVFLASGSATDRAFRLIIIRVGKSFENVASYAIDFTGEPTDPAIRDVLLSWLELVRVQLRRDSTRW